MHSIGHLRSHLRPMPGFVRRGVLTLRSDHTLTFTESLRPTHLQSSSGQAVFALDTALPPAPLRCIPIPCVPLSDLALC